MENYEKLMEKHNGNLGLVINEILERLDVLEGKTPIPDEEQDLVTEDNAETAVAEKD